MMVAPVTPFSGISLIVHLAIIGVAYLLSLFSIRTGFAGGGTGSYSPSSRIINSIFAALIFLAITLLMLTAFIVALSTSVREGANEWQNVYLNQQFEYVRENPPRLIYSGPLTFGTRYLASEAAAMGQERVTKRD